VVTNQYPEFLAYLESRGYQNSTPRALGVALGVPGETIEALLTGRVIKEEDSNILWDSTGRTLECFRPGGENPEKTSLSEPDIQPIDLKGAKGMSSKVLGDFEAYLKEQGLDEFNNEVIAQKLSEGRTFTILGRVLRRFRNGAAISPRTSWMLWVATGKTVKSLRPKAFNHLYEWLFEHNLTVAQLSKKTGIVDSSLQDYFSKGVEPQGENRIKLFAATGLRTYAPKNEGASRGASVPSKPTNSIPSTPGVGNPDPVSLNSEVLSRLESIDLGLKEIASRPQPSGREILADLLETFATLLRGPRERTEEPHQSPSDPTETKDSSFAGLVSLVEDELERLAGSTVDTRALVRKSLDSKQVVRVGSGVAAFVKESDFQSWQESQVDL